MRIIKTKTPKQINPVKYLYSNVLHTGKHRLKKVNSLKVPTMCKTEHSNEVKTATYYKVK